MVTIGRGSESAPDKFDIPSGQGVRDGGHLLHGDEDPENSMPFGLKCPMCWCRSKRFYCELCIRNGDFRHSSACTVYDPSYSKRLFDYLKAHDIVNRLNARGEQMLQKTLLVRSVRHRINNKNERVKILREMVHKLKKDVARAKQSCTEIAQKNVEIRHNLPKYDFNVRNIEDYVANKRTGLDEKKLELQITQRNLRLTAKNRIMKLIKFIFPIEYTSSNADSQTFHGPSSSSMEFAQATRLDYVDGNWVMQDHSFSTCSSTSSQSTDGNGATRGGSSISEQQLMVVAATLPRNGNYNAYGQWLAMNRENLPNNHDPRLDHNAAFRIMAGLTYTALLLQVLRFYLDVRLPFKVNAPDFCTGVSDSMFQKRVTRLNANIVHLLYTQGIRLNDVHPAQTLENLKLLLDMFERGEDRVAGSFVDPSNINFNHIDAHFSPILRTMSDSDTGDEDNSFGFESLDISPQSAIEMLEQEQPGAAPNVTPAQPFLPTSNAIQTTSMMTSAAASIASIFSRWNYNR